ncbi:MAG: SOS response-associated peptidase [Planctomycetes bacterium]|nr:SOS response-associated peptidase [Planctomycetota bacterium]
MCGRFACSEIPKALAEFFGIPCPSDLPPRENIAPSMNVSALIRDEASNAPVFAWLKWGLLPFWAKDKNMGARMFNARAETAHVKPSFRAAMRHRRCLIPADGFYEWRKEGEGKKPYLITINREFPMVFAGLWELWEEPAGEIILSCTILTTATNEAIRPFHDRMPVILPPKAWEIWMDRNIQSHRDLARLLRPCPADAIRVEEASI